MPERVRRLARAHRSCSHAAATRAAKRRQRRRRAGASQTSRPRARARSCLARRCRAAPGLRRRGRRSKLRGPTTPSAPSAYSSERAAVRSMRYVYIGHGPGGHGAGTARVSSGEASEPVLLRPREAREPATETDMMRVRAAARVRHDDRSYPAVRLRARSARRRARRVARRAVDADAPRTLFVPADRDEPRGTRSRVAT